MKYLQICSLYTYTAIISLILFFLAFLVIAIPEQNYNSGSLVLILHKNETSVLLIVSASILFKSGICHCLHLPRLCSLLST